MASNNCWLNHGKRVINDAHERHKKCTGIGMECLSIYIINRVNGFRHTDLGGIDVLHHATGVSCRQTFVDSKVGTNIKCEVVAKSFKWWETTANKYLEEDNWTEGRKMFVEERYSIYERVQRGLEANNYLFTVPTLPNKDTDFRVRMSVVVTGFRSKEYIHLISPANKSNLLLYRTKNKSFSFPQNSTVRGIIYPYTDKTFFAGVDFPTICRANLILKD